MPNIKSFKIEQKFNGLEELYNYLFKNIKFIEDATDIKIQKPLKGRMHCVVGREKITERNILFFASQNGFIESLGELITLASVFEAGIIIFFINEASKTYLSCINWLQQISNDDTQFIVGEISF